MDMGGMFHGADPEILFNKLADQICYQGGLAAAGMADDMKRDHGISWSFCHKKNLLP
jgi:hypothetical protein